ncbi:MAG: paraquat-inducible protein A [Neptuniibacter sp.]
MHSLNIPLFKLGVVAAFILLIIGLVSPMMTMSKFYFFESSFSVIGGVAQLFQEGKWLIAIIVALFSIIIPLIKLTFLLMLTKKSAETSNNQKHYLKLMHEYGRWAMLDVLVVAVLIVTVKLGAVASVEIHWGLYVFAAAVVLIMFLTHKAERIVNE